MTDIFGAVVVSTRVQRAGFTLVEVLVSLAIFLVFLASLFWLFVGGLRSNRVVGEQSRSVQEAEGVLQLLSYELGLAGFRGTDLVPLEFAPLDPADASVDNCRTQMFTLCVQLGAAETNDEVWIRFFEVGGPVAEADAPERWVSYRVRDGVLQRVNQLIESTAVNRVQDLVGGVDVLVVEALVRRNRSVIDRTAVASEDWVDLSEELAGVRLRAEFSDDTVWRFVVGLANPQTVRVFQP